MKKIIGKRYYCIIFELKSPLSVGSGENNETDSDIVMDSCNHPYIPGSSMVGVYRSMLTEEAADQYFGKELKGTNHIDESQIIVYDANLCDKQSEYVSKRDMVALDEYKVAIPGCKFDFQVIEPGVKFITYVEQNIYEKSDKHIFENILHIWKNKGICFGAKTQRGYGQTVATDIKVAEFEKIQGNKSWLDFDLYEYSGADWKTWKDTITDDKSDEIRIVLDLSAKGGVSIREYSTRVESADYAQLSLHGKEHTPVIPGTTWAGAFQANMKKLGLSEDEKDIVFGCVKKIGDKIIKRKSKISFLESQIDGGKDVIYSRNAIDRFTNAIVEQALYTESTHYNGTTSLIIACKKDALTENVIRILAACVMDLHNGYLAIGGLTSIGRGLFSINTIQVNGKSVEVEYQAIYQAIIDGQKGAM